MNSSRSSHPDHELSNFNLGVTLSTAIFSLVLGLLATMSNGLLLLTMYKDPFRYFRSHATSYFVFSLALSDLLGGLVSQLFYASFLFAITAEVNRRVLLDIAHVSSHLVTKISILTVVALSVDRFLTIKLRMKYKDTVTVRRVLICNVCIWLSTALFESIHAAVLSKETFHTIDLHVQTTLPLTTLVCVYLATYVCFKRYTRNTVLVLAGKQPTRTSRLTKRNVVLEKKMTITVVLIFLVLFVSHIPNLVVNKIEEQCHEAGERQNCIVGSKTFEVSKAFSFPLLCVSCALNPFFYAFRIPQYNAALNNLFRSVGRRTGLDQSTSEPTMKSNRQKRPTPEKTCSVW